MSSLSDLGLSIPAIDVLGVRIDDVTMEQAIAVCHACIRSGRPHRVATPNAEFVAAARGDPDFRRLLNDSTLSIPDGAGLLLAGRILGTPLREQVTGTDLAEQVAGLCADEGFRLFLLGAAPGVAELAARQLTARYPALIVAGTFVGSPDPVDDAEIYSHLRQAGRIDVLLVAYGARKQERWIARNQVALGIPLTMGVGGVFDFWSGRVRRAPALVRRLGFDWLFRLIVQPWRWRRQLALPRFLVAVVVVALRRRLGYPPPSPRRGGN